MVKIPSLSRRSEPSSTRDENERANPAVDGRDETRPAATGPAAPAGVDPTAPTGPGRVPTGRDAERTTYRGGAVTDPEPTSDTERRAAERAAVARAATIRPTEAGARADRDATVVGDDRTGPYAPTGTARPPRTRTRSRRRSRWHAGRSPGPACSPPWAWWSASPAPCSC